MGTTADETSADLERADDVARLVRRLREAMPLLSEVDAGAAVRIVLEEQARA